MGLRCPLIFMTSLRRHNVSEPSKFRKYSQYTFCTQRIDKFRFLANNRRNMQFSRNLKKGQEIIIPIYIPSYKLIFLQICYRQNKNHEVLPTSSTNVHFDDSSCPYDTRKVRCIFVKRCVIGLV